MSNAPRHRVATATPFISSALDRDRGVLARYTIITSKPRELNHTILMSKWFLNRTTSTGEEGSAQAAAARDTQVFKVGPAALRLSVGGGTRGVVSYPLPHAWLLTREKKHLAGAVRACQFSAGANPNNQSLTTGLGPNPVRFPLHIDATGKDSDANEIDAPSLKTFAAHRCCSDSPRPPRSSPAGSTPDRCGRLPPPPLRLPATFGGQ